jgi:hypothetical protein
MPNLINLNDKYTIRDGRVMVLYILDGKGEYFEVIGQYEYSPGVWGVSAWGIYGTSLFPDEYASRDLIPAPKTVQYLKTIETILAENPDAYFDCQGDLRFKEPHNDMINMKMFQYFGKPYDNRNKDWVYAPSWIEDREVT